MLCRKKMLPPLGITYLTILSVVVVIMYHVVLDRVGGGRNPAFLEPSLRQSDPHRRQLEKEQYIDERILEVFKETWPECVAQGMTAIECKLFIDDEIMSTNPNLFTDRDKYIRVIIKGKRSTGDEWYNTVVITMNDADMAVGIENDGKIEYDFAWQGSGAPATPEQEAAIPPVLAVETEAGSPQVDIADPETPLEIALLADPESVDYEPLILEEEPMLVEGTTVEGALLGSDTNPIAGGCVVDPNTPNTVDGDEKLEAVIKEFTTAAAPTGEPGGEIAVEEAGPRALPAFDCDGLTGYNCCLMIKLMVRDADEYGNAIQCQLMYQEGSNKEKFWLNSRGKKVFIFANHNDLVSKIPQIVGDWPKGQDEFSTWVEAGGDPDQVLEGY